MRLPAWVVAAACAAAMAPRAGALRDPALITGEYIEDRSNKVFGCYCEWSGEGEHGGREAVLAWHFQSGEYAGQNLEGLSAAAVIVGERTLSRGHSPRRSVLYVDAAAPPAQQEAGLAWIRARYGEILGRILAAHTVPIDFRMSAAEAALAIGDLAGVRMRRARLPEDALQGAILWYDPFTPLASSHFGTTVHVHYSGPDFDFRWMREDPGVSGYYGTFALP